MAIIARVIAAPVKGDLYRFDYGACLYPEGMVGEIQQNVHNIKYPIMHRNIQPDWQGKQKDDFTKQWETFSSDYTSFQTEMNTFYDAVCDEITRLENQKNEENGIIGWCQSQINSLGNFIEKLLHTKEG